ncbi:hypothetical protein [Actinokineospora diospyrosa]|uniref:CHAP domain-containing protein n=1 Tax=Actinokineospora diospyrosa TaxID=103728 RepID=A0ABT1IFT4_9PSEU|nr:hypothetical protein [Actinokineospora diospyrosa]MCP2271510.1 hypothetical protein [Actinokineospora diospyrosa]
MRKLVLLAVIAAVTAACSSGTPSGQATAPTTTPAAAAPTVDEIGCLTTGGPSTTANPAPAVPTTTTQGLRAAPRLAGSAAVLTEIEHELNSYEKSDYQHTTTIDPTAGTYIVDCSGWGNVLLRTAACDAYGDLVRAANAARKTTFSTSCDLTKTPVEHGPYAVDWATMLSALTPGASNGHWTRVAKVPDLVPGDIVTYALGPGASDTGHVMFVAGKPYQGTNTSQWTIPIADSTAFQHGPTDSRKGNPRNVDGKGIGTAEIALVVDGDTAPTNQFLWYPTADHLDTVPAPVLLGHLT